MDHKRYIVIAGPTASGKSRIAVEAARRAGAEIVSADSMMVYRGMDVGTAKPAPEERGGVAHHCIDLVDPDGRFDAALFRGAATAAIREIGARGRPAIVVGGTGLWLRALRRGLVEAPPRDEMLRAELEAAAREKGSAHLHGELARVDPGTASAVSPADLVRIVRALEIFRLTGVPASVLRGRHAFGGSAPAPSLFLVLSPPRDALRAAIGARAAAMAAGGLLDEVRGLLAAGYGPELAPMRALNYRHALRRLAGLVDREGLVREMELDTWHFARRQMNWFNAEEGAEPIAPDAAAVLERVRRYLEG